MTAQCIAPTGARRTRFGETPRYQEGLYAVGDRTYAWMVPNGSWGESNAGLVIGDGQSLLIDTLWDPRLTSDMLRTMEPLTRDAPISSLVNTHADGDHFWGNQLLPGVDSITSEAARAEMDEHKPATMLKFGRLGAALKRMPMRRARRPGQYFSAMCAPYAFNEVKHTPARRGFKGRHELTVGGRKVTLIEVGPAHTKGDLIVHVPDAGVVFTGDVLFIGSTPVMWAGPLSNWLAALDLIDGLGADVIIPGHGPVTGSEGVRQVRDYWDYARREIGERHDAGMPPHKAARDLVLSEGFRRSPF
ncbi:MAG: MBL fold metallo-hydrolase, partial [Pseudomonadota bacterium]|nr:MBL fold metallo-hydrolase [Pseudomonadota bacterium]